METKECTHCHKAKPIEEGFYLIRKGGKKVRASWCKECSNAYTREWNTIERERARRRKAEQLEELKPYLEAAKAVAFHIDNPRAKWSKAEVLGWAAVQGQKDGIGEVAALGKAARLAIMDIWNADGEPSARLRAGSWRE
jgi:hypothetical protein